MTDRKAIRDNAKYLRQIRPIDPEEISDYVEGTPHPAVVRQVLREEAVDLGLVERADGTFVPAPERVVSGGWQPEKLPDQYAHAFEDLLVDRYGLDWHEGESGAHLRETIRRLKEQYYRQHPVEYDADVAFGYGIYHLPDYYASVGYVLDRLTERDLLTTPLRVLDIGAGTGGPALGLHDFVSRESDEALVDYHAVEPSAATEILEHLLGETGRNFHPTIHRSRVESLDLDGLAGERAFDLLLFSNVLSELDDPVAVVERALSVLSDDGAVLALEPADLNTATTLRQVERELVTRTDVGVYAPTLRLWPGAEPSDRGWSFDVQPDVEVPPFQSRLARGAPDEEASAFRNPTVQFAYAVLRPDGVRRSDLTANPKRHAKMADLDRHVTERIDLLAVKLSRDLTDAPDANPLFKLGDGSEETGVFGVLTKRTSLNGTLVTAPYGAVLRLEQALALWNDDEDAYNLVVDDATIVDFLG
jgi:SAM-dependent methyltransferase